MPLSDNLPQLALVSAALYVAWVILRPFIVKSPVHNIPGPPARSWIGGKPYFSTRPPRVLKDTAGNLPQLLSPRDSWTWRDEIARDYGRVALLHGQFGVCTLASLLEDL